jgi:hypothetical protein
MDMVAIPVLVDEDILVVVEEVAHTVMLRKATMHTDTSNPMSVTLTCMLNAWGYNTHLSIWGRGMA